MPGVFRWGDMLAGHGQKACIVANNISMTTTQTKRLKTVFVNGFHVAYLGDEMNVSHCGHKVKQAQTGSLTVYFEGLPVVRTGDTIKCEVSTDLAGPGSLDVIVDS